MNLGIRFGGSLPTADMLRASRAFDVYSLNVYGRTGDHKAMAKIHRVTGRSIIVGEFHFGVPGRGLAAFSARYGHRRLQAVHAGKAAPFDMEPRAQ